MGQHLVRRTVNIINMTPQTKEFDRLLSDGETICKKGNNFDDLLLVKKKKGMWMPIIQIKVCFYIQWNG